MRPPALLSYHGLLSVISNLFCIYSISIAICKYGLSFSCNNAIYELIWWTFQINSERCNYQELPAIVSFSTHWSSTSSFIIIVIPNSNNNISNTQKWSRKNSYSACIIYNLPFARGIVWYMAGSTRYCFAMKGWLFYPYWALSLPTCGGGTGWKKWDISCTETRDRMETLGLRIMDSVPIPSHFL